ncbi:MAG: type I-E CRISPR-associated protein Cas5/CasD [Fimbriimonadaceae bacterium]|nr:type I-E CRISPR-associated protein Cas5/CasD [Fimbriimonadaceae bacterium]
MLLLRLEAPLQSWGYRSRFTTRDTGLEPTKSGVIGLLCCALGRDRKDSIDDLRSLVMCVRVDRQGDLLSDYQTAGAGTFRGSEKYFAPTSDGGRRNQAILLEKHYLQDASFLVALQGDGDLLSRLAEALQDPVWPLSLGRRSCPPAVPVFVGLRHGAADDVLRTEPRHHRCDRDLLRLIRELPVGEFTGEARRDTPLAWPDRQTRIYTDRYVQEELIEGPAT